MYKILIIGVCAMALGACGGKAVDATDTGVTETAPEVTLPETTTPTSAEAFKTACLASAVSEDVDEHANKVCTCATTRLSAELGDSDLAIAAKALSYATPSAAREGLADETDRLGEIIGSISESLEDCD